MEAAAAHLNGVRPGTRCPSAESLCVRLHCSAWPCAHMGVPSFWVQAAELPWNCLQQGARPEMQACKASKVGDSYEHGQPGEQGRCKAAGLACSTARKKCGAMLYRDGLRQMHGLSDLSLDTGSSWIGLIGSSSSKGTHHWKFAEQPWLCG